jgi:hypothetical protein
MGKVDIGCPRIPLLFIAIDRSRALAHQPEHVAMQIFSGKALNQFPNIPGHKSAFLPFRKSLGQKSSEK